MQDANTKPQRYFLFWGRSFYKLFFVNGLFFLPVMTSNDLKHMTSSKRGEELEQSLQMPFDGQFIYTVHKEHSTQYVVALGIEWSVPECQPHWDFPHNVGEEDRVAWYKSLHRDRYQNGRTRPDKESLIPRVRYRPFLNCPTEFNYHLRTIRNMAKTLGSVSLSMGTNLNRTLHFTVGWENKRLSKFRELTFRKVLIKSLGCQLHLRFILAEVGEWTRVSCVFGAKLTEIFRFHFSPSQRKTQFARLHSRLLGVIASRKAKDNIYCLCFEDESSKISSFYFMPEKWWPEAMIKNGKRKLTLQAIKSIDPRIWHKTHFEIARNLSKKSTKGATISTIKAL